MGERHDHLRAADADRQLAADRLQVALNEGRLDLLEYDGRLQQAYTAKTYGELDRILDDLPPEVGTGTPSVPTDAARATGTGRRRGVPTWMLTLWGSWLAVTAISMLIYVLSDFRGSAWPIWVAGQWAGILLIRTLKAHASGNPHRYVAAGHDGRHQMSGRDPRYRQRLDRQPAEERSPGWEQSDRRARYYGRQYRWR
ncbi:DUF1707 SHOCT-like domain-containing protein [Rugosimonospora africana]|uniref:DUF1707 domain-containing protein n=1 Tax=Rugosimonospora africana TaxID=556532 RepID=A0A8J3QU93_9ACTN|nr:DUF1707 domain-containing protein [Rugosimonospora africana]GIH16649.1 hypothetical protein Raf01_48210 [Rugosimonospora africana]